MIDSDNEKIKIVLSNMNEILEANGLPHWDMLTDEQRDDICSIVQDSYDDAEALGISNYGWLCEVVAEYKERITH